MALVTVATALEEAKAALASAKSAFLAELGKVEALQHKHSAEMAEAQKFVSAARAVVVDAEDQVRTHMSKLHAELASVLNGLGPKAEKDLKQVILDAQKSR